MANVPKAKKFMSKDNASSGGWAACKEIDNQAGMERPEERRRVEAACCGRGQLQLVCFDFQLESCCFWLRPLLPRSPASPAVRLPAVSCLAVCAPCSTLGHLLCAFWKYNKDSTGHIMHFACLHKYLHNTKRGDTPGTPLRPLHSQPSRQSSVTNCQK